MTRRKSLFTCAACGRVGVEPANRNAKRCAECFARLMPPEEMVRRYVAGERAADIAKVAGVSDREVFYRLHLAGVTPNLPRPPKAEMTTEEMAALRAAGRSVIEIARMAGLTRASVYTRLAGYTPEPEPAPAPASDVPDGYVERLGAEGRTVYAADACGHVWRLEPGRPRAWECLRRNWDKSRAAYRIAHPRKRIDGPVEIVKYRWSGPAGSGPGPFSGAPECPAPTGKRRYVKRVDGSGACF